MAQVTNNTVVQTLKRVYGDFHNLISEDYPLQKLIKFSEGNKVGDRFVEAFALSSETGWTLLGDIDDVQNINPAISGVVKQSSVKPSAALMQSVIPFTYMSRAAGGTDKAFFDATRHLMENHLRSHSRLLEAIRLYGQSPDLMGYLTYAPTGTSYRGAIYSGPGDVVLTKGDGTTITFVDGVSAANKAALLQPGQYASGLWVALEGAIIKQVDSTGAVVKTLTLIGTDSNLGILYFDDVPVVATAQRGAGSYRFCYNGQEIAPGATTGKDMIGIHRILTNTGTLFDISAAQYSLWKSNVIDCQGRRWNIKAMQLGIAQGDNAGGLTGGLELFMNPLAFSAISNDETSLRNFDASYKSSTAQNGFESIEWFGSNGLNRIRPHRMVKDGEVFGLLIEDWIRSGSADVAFKIPGMDKDLIFPLEQQTGWCIRSFSDQYIMCRAPARQILWTNCNFEAAPF